MKKIGSVCLAFLFLLSFALCGCGEGIKVRYVTTLKNWFFQENAGANEYDLFFSLHGDDGDAIDAEVTADVRIEDESGNVLYKKTHTVTEKDYGDYTRQNTELHLACVRVPKSAVLPGVSSSGKAYLKVYREEIVEFDEVSCDVYYGLPVKDVKLVCDELPMEVNIIDYSNRVEGAVRIDEIKYSSDCSFSTVNLEIEVLGVKIKGKTSSLYDIINYKIYDSQGYRVKDGSLYLSSLSEGDKFKEKISIYSGITPGETYTIKFEEHGY